MAETEEDRRARLLVLVSHGLLAAPGSTEVGPGLLAWAHDNHWGIQQLPEPLHRIDPRAAATPAGSAEDRGLLDAVFEQLQVYLQYDHRLVGAVWAGEEVVGEAGRVWLDQVAASAAAAGVPLGSAWFVPAGATTWSVPTETILAALVTREPSP